VRVSPHVVKWIGIGLGVLVLLWLVSDINVNATITEGIPTLTYKAAGTQGGA
jgi:hypothetical protein